MANPQPFATFVRAFLTCFGWTTRCLEENPIHRFGLNTSRSCDASLQFPLNLVRDSEKRALSRFRYDAEADAP